MNIHIVLRIFKQKLLARDIYEGKITIQEADKYQTDLLVEIMSFRKNTIPMSQEKKKKEKEFVLENLYNFGRGEIKFLTLLKAKYF